MSTQIAVRLPDHLVAFLDRLVVDGSARSRAHAVTKALMKYERQISAERDAEIYRTTGPDQDMQALAEWGARQPMPELD
ncbi:ribbon-helix-helix domain-containing protein [Marmoricola sp. RAF53]|uniref:ribbon-helix-helix domain-containing protein n=1 Tax=Marmoricola sp. RAF53 TaxID=3233059 RepID=UPI003F9A2CC8